MDRSFLTNAEVVEASRQFVCIRLATYEDKAEAEFMKKLYTPRSGVMENTTFGILSPDGKSNLIRPGRGPHAFRRGSDLARSMDQLAEKYPNSQKMAGKNAALPTMKNVELGLNVASSDSLPLIVAFGENDKQLAKIAKTLLPVAWKEPLAGQFVFATTTNRKDLKPIPGVKGSAGILVVQPGQFGLSGKLLAEFSANDALDQFQSQLDSIVAKFPRTHKDHNNHVQLGIRLGIDWKSEIPETDPMSVRARKQLRGE